MVLEEHWDRKSITEEEEEEEEFSKISFILTVINKL